MISSRKEYKEFLEWDRIAIEKKRKYPLPFADYEWKFIRSLRRYEYYINCWGEKGVVGKFFILITRILWQFWSLKTTITIYPNCFDKGLAVWHYGTIIVNDRVKSGTGVSLQCGINISEDVKIGNNVYIAPGAKILKGVSIPDGVIIGANAVVAKSISDSYSYTTWVGVPARLSSNKGYIDKTRLISNYKY